jgi:hypothetical protein
MMAYLEVDDDDDDNDDDDQYKILKEGKESLTMKKTTG